MVRRETIVIALALPVIAAAIPFAIVETPLLPLLLTVFSLEELIMRVIKIMF